MKRVLISIVLATVFASIPVFAERSEKAEPANGVAVVLTNEAAPGAPQYRRRYRRRYIILRRRHYRRRHYRRRHYRRIYIIRRRRRY